MISNKRTSGSVAMDDYLEQICHLIADQGYARPIDIAKSMNVSQASVTNMLKRLDEEGLVKHIKYRGSTLTIEGKTIAEAIIKRHEVLTKFLRLFELNEDTIYKDVEGMEHHVSVATLEVISALATELSENTTLLEKIKVKISSKTID